MILFKRLITVLSGNSAEWLKEPLINSEVPAAQGRAVIFDRCKRLKMKQTENHTFLFACSENAKDGIIQSFLR